MLDAHTHLIDHSFANDLPLVLQASAKAGVRGIVVVGQNADENEKVLNLVKQQASKNTNLPFLLPFLGFHPDLFADSKPLPTKQDWERVILQIEHHANEIKGRGGIGEVGLDDFVCRTRERRHLQREAFEQLVHVAINLGLPLNVHSRSCGKRTLELLLRMGAKQVLMHAFDGKAGHAMLGAEMGYVFSVPATVIHSEQKQRMVRALPLHALALETDSPALGPLAGERNTPMNVCIVRDCLAKLKHLTATEITYVTTQNIQRVFALSFQGKPDQQATN